MSNEFPPRNWREFIAQVCNSWLLGPLSTGFVGVVLGITGDTAEEGMSEGVKMPWLLEPTSPPDALPLIGSERRMPRYPGETDAQYRARLYGAWDTYQFGGDENTILGQLALAGFPGAEIFDPGNATFSPPSYWSHFIIVFPLGTHTVTAAGPAYGSFNWGATNYGPVGLTADTAATIRGIIAKWKPVQWICRLIVFQVQGWAYGDGHNWGDASLTWGGVTVSTGP